MYAVNNGDEMNPFPGQPGQKGEGGEQGLKGEKGDRGDSGPGGMPGMNGMPGPTGEKGESGTDGIPGISGTAGLKGERGERGPPGPVTITDSGAQIVTIKVKKETHFLNMTRDGVISILFKCKWIESVFAFSLKEIHRGGDMNQST